MEGGDGPRGGGLVTGESKISRLRVLFFFFFLSILKVI